MTIAIHFKKVVKVVRSAPLLRIDDIRIHKGECMAFYGLSKEYSEIITNLMTGASIPDEGSVQLLGTDSREISDDRVWFRFLENFGIFSSKPVFQESASIGENLATLFRIRNDSIEEPQLSACVLHLANLVQLTITDLSKMMSETTPLLRTKVRLARAVVYHPKVVVMCDPTSGLPTDTAQKLYELIRRTRRKLGYTLVFFTSDVWLLRQLAQRVLLLNPQEGSFVENRLRQWYHNLFSFLDPAPAQLLQLSRDIRQHSRILKGTESMERH